MVRPSIPGMDAMETCSCPSKLMASYDSSENTRTWGPVRSRMSPARTSSCSRVATLPVGLDGKFRKMSAVRSFSSGSNTSSVRPNPSSSRSTAGTGTERKYGMKDSYSG